MTPRRALVLVCLAALGLGAVGCSPSPAEPSPKRTAAFDSEEAAFAAAEETYRAYVDAENARAAGEDDPDPQDFLIGAALDADIESRRELDRYRLREEGSANVAGFRPVSAEYASSTPQITAVVCINVSATRLRDDQGRDVTPTSRPDVVALEVSLVSVDHELKISKMSASEVAC